MTSNEMRSVRDELRHQHNAALDEIEDVVVTALDRLVEEAIVWGADELRRYLPFLATTSAPRPLPQ